MCDLHASARLPAKAGSTALGHGRLGAARGALWEPAQRPRVGALPTPEGDAIRLRESARLPIGRERRERTPKAYPLRRTGFHRVVPTLARPQGNSFYPHTPGRLGGGRNNHLTWSQQQFWCACSPPLNGNKRGANWPNTVDPEVRRGRQAKGDNWFNGNGTATPANSVARLRKTRHKCRHICLIMSKGGSGLLYSGGGWAYICVRG